MDTGFDVLFNPGNVITCTTCFDQKLEGEVVAFDYDRRIMVLKSPSLTNQANHHDVHLLNLKYVGDIVLKDDKTQKDNTVTPINIAKVSSSSSCCCFDLHCFLTNL